MVKESPCQGRRCRRRRFDYRVRKIPWKTKWQPTPVFFPGKAHGQRSLAGYSPKGHKELDTTERLCIHAKTNKEYLRFMFREYLNMSSQLLRFGTRIFITYMAQKSPSLKWKRCTISQRC